MSANDEPLVSAPHSAPDAAPEGPAAAALELVVAGTFTVEPLDAPLTRLLELLKFDASVRFAPYNQVFQQLLDPTSDLARRATLGALVLLRMEDFLRDRPTEEAPAERERHLRSTLEELVAAVDAFARRGSSPLLVVEAPSLVALHEPSVERFRQAMQEHPDVHWLSLTAEELGGGAAFDAVRDRLGHLPFSDIGYARLSALALRKLHAARIAPRKVLVLDCDNTLWGGVVGEDGVDGIALLPGFEALQRFACRLVDEGVLVALCSKNVDEDVVRAFEQRTDFPLRLEHIVSRRVNWLPKAQNLLALAEELNLGLDSFVFLDDNPVECGQVQAALPQVLTLRVPPAEELVGWVEQLWMFDRLKVTDEDRVRTEMYRQNAARRQFEDSSGSIEAFLQGLNLEVDSAVPAPDELPRIAQLTQRTNQFNATTIRRNEPEVRELQEQGVMIRRQRVQDRFGDYGLVGVFFLRPVEGQMQVDTFLLSCRVLGRGVEHTMLREAASLTLEQGGSQLVVPFVPTAKNEPMRAFLESVPDGRKEPSADGVRYVFSAQALTALQHRPGGDPEAVKEAARGKRQSSGSSSVQLPQYGEIARLAADASALSREGKPAARERAASDAVVPPETPVERELRDFWQELLGLSEVGVTDDFFELGGTSLLAVSLVAHIEARHGTRLPLTTILTRKTVRALAQRIEKPATARPGDHGEECLLLQPGDAEREALFLIHDGDGEVLLYRNLAQKMPPGVRVYGLTPHAAQGVPLASTTVEGMAQRFVAALLRLQPHGTYHLGGLCAGGTIAVEVARQLELREKTVAAVHVFDAAAPGAVRRVGVTTGRRWNRFTQIFSNTESSRPMQSAAAAATKVGNLLRYEVRSRSSRARDVLLFRLLGELLRRGESWPLSLPPWDVRRIYDLAAEQHSPLPLRGAPVFVYKATDGDADDEAYRFLYADEDLGWSRVCSKVKVVDVSGGHGGMLQEQHVEEVARVVCDCFETAPAAVGAPGLAPWPSSMSSRPKVLVCIVNYNAARLACDCLDSLDAEVRELGARVLVVDNPAGGKDAATIEQHVRTRGYQWCEVLPQQKNGGFAAGNNAAIRYAECNPPDYYLLLNPDTTIQAGAVRNLVEYMEAHDEVGLAGSRQLDPEGKVASSIFSFPSIASELEHAARTGPISQLLKRYVVSRPPSDSPIETDWVSGASLMIRREVVEQLGLMDENYFLYFEEVDYCLAAARRGWKCVHVPQSVVVHHEGQSTGVSDPAQAKRRLPPYWHDSRERFFRKNFGMHYALAANIAWFAGLAVHSTRQLLKAQGPDLRQFEVQDRAKWAWKNLRSL